MLLSGLGIVLTLWLFPLRYERSKTESPSDKLRTHIRPSIKILRPFRWVNLELCLDLLPLDFATKLTAY